MIKDIKEEGKIEIKCLITKCDKGKTSKNTPYLSLTLEDKSGILDAKFWNMTDEMIQKYHVGMVVEAKGDIILHRNVFQLRVQHLTILDTYDIHDYVRGAPVEVSNMKDEIYSAVEGIKNKILKDICYYILKENEEDYFSFPAATRNHHAYVGGLAYHSLSMLKLGLGICKQYEWLDQDLIIAGVLMHDVGKLTELSSAVLPEYTSEGNLLGHISIMVSIIDHAARECGYSEDESVVLLKHMVLSHHGKLEYGSPVLPMIPEAEVLATIDNLDARLVMMKQSLDMTEPGHFGPRIFALENRMIYKRKQEEE